MSCPTCDASCDDDIDLGTFATGSVDRIRITIKKDGVAWTGIDSVTLRLRDPDGNESDLAMTLETPDAGVWYYDTLTTDIDESGDWTAGLKVVDGAITKWYPGEIALTAVNRS